MDKVSRHKDTPRYVTELSREMRQHPTDSEAKLWERLSNRKLNGIKFRRQFPIERYIVDFYSHQCNLVIEIDGSVHDNQKEFDHNRTRDIESRGYRVIRFSNSEVNSKIEDVLARIMLACTQ